MRYDGMVFYAYIDGDEKWVKPERLMHLRLDSLLAGLKRRSRKKGVPFDLTRNYLMSIYPEDSRCPVFGIEMAYGGYGDGKRGGTENSPSIDRIIPHLGYVPGNVIWVSLKANWMKNCGTVEELFTVAQFYQRLLHNPSLYLPGHTIH